MNKAKAKQPIRTKARKSVTLQLREDEEKDLITWLDDIPDGQRQTVMRDALRAYKGQAGRDARQATRADLSELWQAFEGRLATLIEPQPGGESGDAIRGIAVALAALDSKINRLASGTLTLTEQPADVIEVTPRLSDDEIERRAKRMKQSKQW